MTRATTNSSSAQSTTAGGTLSDLSRVDRLGEEIAVLAARLHAATYDLLVLLQQFDAACGWNNGFLSCAHWLHWRTGIDLGAAREKVRVARALPDLPRLSEAMQRGSISYAKVRALTRVATRDNEARLLDVALSATAAQVERVARAWRRCDRVSAAREADARHLHRGLRTYVDDDGMLVVQGRLTPEQGALVQRALDAAANRLWRESREAAAPNSVVEEITTGQRRADALVQLAEAALSAGLDAGTAGDRYQVVLHVDAVRDPSRHGDLLHDESAHGQAACDESGPAPTSSPLFEASVIECGDRAVDVSAETSARLSCDAAVVVLHHDNDGSTIDVGRRTRSVPPAIRRALLARDTGCRFPGCTARRCDAHHVVHWAEGGPTCLENLLLLCRRHHRLLHEGGYTVIPGAGRTFAFVSPAGRPIDAAPAAHVAGASVHSLPEGCNGRPATAPVWDGTPFNLVYVIDALRGGESLPVSGSA